MENFKMAMKNNYEKLLEQLDIVEVLSEYGKLFPKGSDFKMLCPFHEDKFPSLSISVKKQIWRCFVCNVGGNAISFVEKKQNISYTQAAELIAKDVNVEWKGQSELKNKVWSEGQKELLELNSKVMNWFKYNILDTNNIKLQKYLKERNLDNEIIKYFNLGFEPEDDEIIKLFKQTPRYEILAHQLGLLNSYGNDCFFKNRLIFPILDEDNNVLGFSGRLLETTAQNVKYLNSSESSIFNKKQILFNLNNASKSMLSKKELIVCEGFMDVIALHKVGIDNVVALMGTAWSDEHSTKLVKFKNEMKIVLFLDGDKAGQNAMIKTLLKLIEDGFKVEIVNNTSDLDPDEILNSHGITGLKKVLEQRKSAIEFYYQYLSYGIPSANLNDVDLMKITLQKFSKVWAKCDIKTKEFYIIKWAQFWKIEPDIVKLWCGNAREDKPNKMVLFCAQDLIDELQKQNIEGSQIKVIVEAMWKNKWTKK